MIFFFIKTGATLKNLCDIYFYRKTRLEIIKFHRPLENDFCGESELKIFPQIVSQIGADVKWQIQHVEIEMDGDSVINVIYIVLIVKTKRLNLSFSLVWKLRRFFIWMIDYKLLIRHFDILQKINEFKKKSLHWQPSWQL